MGEDPFALGVTQGTVEVGRAQLGELAALRLGHAVLAGSRPLRLSREVGLTGNPHDAEDLTQEVFVRVFRSLSSYTPGTFEGWLHRITTNLFLDGARRKAKIRFDAFAEDAETRIPSRGVTPDTQVLDGTFDEDVETALAALSPEFRAAVVLCDIEGLSYDEIASVLDIKIGTVRSRIHRGRAQLRKALAHRRPTPDRARYLGVDVESGEPVSPTSRLSLRGREPARTA